MNTVLWTLAAVSDLEQITSRIATDNPSAAVRTQERIAASAESLSRMARGRRGRVAGTYEKVVSGLPYVIAYAVRQRPKRKDQFVVLRVIHMRRDWPTGRWPA